MGKGPSAVAVVQPRDPDRIGAHEKENRHIGRLFHRFQELYRSCYRTSSEHRLERPVATRGTGEVQEDRISYRPALFQKSVRNKPDTIQTQRRKLKRGLIH